MINDPKNTVRRGYVLLEAIDPRITKDDIEIFSIGGFTVETDKGALSFDWYESESSFIDPSENHNLRIECLLKNYDSESFPEHSISDLMSANAIGEVYYEAFRSIEAMDEKTDNVRLRLVAFEIENMLGEEYPFPMEMIDHYNEVVFKD